MWLSCILILALCCINYPEHVYGQLTDPCFSFKVLELSKYRGENCTSKAPVKDLCDIYGTPGWFRSDDGSEMLTRPAYPFACATTFPIWMNGTHPQRADGIVQRQACRVDIHSNCVESYNISVKHCITFFVYLLQRPSACPAAYCFGANKVCPPLEPCDYYYHELLESDDRNSMCPSTSGTQHCDNALKPEWYRLKSKASKQDQKLSNTCPNMYNCGTKNPVWVQGTNPSTGDGIVNTTACVHGTSSCCDRSYPMRIKNCTNFLVYYLQPVTSCPERYCYDNHGTCTETTTNNIEIPTTSSHVQNKNAQVSPGCFGGCITDVAVGVSVAVLTLVLIVGGTILLVLKYKRGAVGNSAFIKA